MPWLDAIGTLHIFPFRSVISSRMAKKKSWLSWALAPKGDTSRGRSVHITTFCAWPPSGPSTGVSTYPATNRDLGVEAPNGLFAPSSIKNDIPNRPACSVPASSVIQAAEQANSIEKNYSSVRLYGSMAATAKCLSVGTEYRKEILQDLVSLLSTSIRGMTGVRKRFLQPRTTVSLGERAI